MQRDADMPPRYNLNVIRSEAFPFLHNDGLRSGIMIDDTSAHYVTIEKYFKTMVYLIELHLMHGLKDTYTLLDAFAGVGSDTIGFMTRYVHENPRVPRFFPITAIEKDADRCLMLRNNVSLFVKDYNFSQEAVAVMQGDTLHLVSAAHHFDVVYMDPPWGDNYQQQDSVRIQVSGAALEGIVQQLMVNRIAQEMIVLKLPKNYDFSEFRRLGIPYTLFEILKSDYSVYMTMMVVPCSEQVKRAHIRSHGWNFRKLECHTV
jgi:16S rRNA G966 N2-methylase RsmD